MNELIKKLNIDETFTKKPKNKQKKYNSIKNNITLVEDYNFMADLLELPKTKEGYKYLFVIVDLATDEFDIEPLKTKTPDEVLKAYKKCIKRPHINKAYASIRTDNGNEFKGVFTKFLYNNHILHKKNLPNRHKQMANVERLNYELGRLFNGYMNHKEIETEKVYREWTDVIDIVRTDLNKFRKKKLNRSNDINNLPVFPFDIAKNPKYKIGDIVHEKLDWAENALANKQPTSLFRVGDYRFSTTPKKIVQVLYMNDYPYYRYLLEGLPNVSYSEYELIPSKEKETKYKVKEIINKRKYQDNTQYLVWWLNYLKKNSTWEDENKLIDDGFKNKIDEYNNSLKNKK
jgi:hypothetical protein